MKFDRSKILAEFSGNPPADGAAIHRFEVEVGFRLPDEYKEFLAIANGGEGFIREAYMMLWRVEELAELNKAYQVAEYAPDLLVFGSNGGGEAFAFDRRSDPMAVVAVPFVGMEIGLANVVGANFSEFIPASFLHDPASTENPREGQRVRQVDRFGKEIFEIHPVILGGSPNDLQNKALLNRQQHIDAVRYWNSLIRDLRNAQVE